MPKWFFLDSMSVHNLLWKHNFFFSQMKFIYKEINETETDCIEFICNLAKFKDQEEKLFKTKQVNNKILESRYYKLWSVSNLLSIQNTWSTC